MKLNFAIFKKGKPLYWIIGGIVVFVFFYLIFNKGSSSAGSSGGGGITTINSGPSDAQIAAATQIGVAQIAANTQNAQIAGAVAIATLQQQGQLQQTYAAADLAKFTAGLDAATASKTLDTQLEIAGLNAEYNFSTAKLAADVTRDQFLSNERIVKGQLETNAAMFKDQVDALKFQSMVGAIQFAPEVDRDNMLALLAATSSGTSLSYYDAGSGSFAVNGGTVIPGHNNTRLPWG